MLVCVVIVVTTQTGTQNDMTIAVAMLEFKSQEALKTYVKGVLSKYSVGEYVSEIDKRFLCELIERHPRRDEKIGVGIKAFKIYRVCGGATKHNNFAIVREDNSIESFSYKQCIENKEPTRRQKITKLSGMLCGIK